MHVWRIMRVYRLRIEKVATRVKKTEHTFVDTILKKKENRFEVLRKGKRNINYCSWEHREEAEGMGENRLKIIDGINIEDIKIMERVWNRNRWRQQLCTDLSIDRAHVLCVCARSCVRVSGCTCVCFFEGKIFLK